MYYKECDKCGIETKEDSKAWHETGLCIDCLNDEESYPETGRVFA